MAGVREYDYKALKLEFIRADPPISVRELCRRNNVSSISAVTRIAREEGWVGQQAEWRSRSTEKTLELLADRDARRNLRVAEVTDSAIDMIDEAVTQVRGRMKHLRPVVVGKDDKGVDIIEYDPELKIAPKDLGNLLEGLVKLRAPARATQDPDNGGVNVHIGPGGNFGLLAQFVKETRARGGPTDQQIPVGAGALPSGAEGAGQD